MCVFVFVWPEGSSVFILFRTGTSQAESAYRYMSIHAHAHTHTYIHANTENTPTQKTHSISSNPVLTLFTGQLTSCLKCGPCIQSNREQNTSST